MTTSRSLTALSLTMAVLLIGSGVSRADTLGDIFRTVRTIKVAVDGGGPRKSGFHGPGYLPTPPSYYPDPHCDPICPPPPPVCHRIYCVYKLDCRGHWQLHREYRQPRPPRQACLAAKNNRFDPPHAEPC